MEKEQRTLRQSSLVAIFCFFTAGFIHAQSEDGDLREYQQLKTLVASRLSNTSDDSVRALQKQVHGFTKFDLKNYPKAERDRERFLLSLVVRFSDDRSYAFRKLTLATLGQVLHTSNGVDDLLAFVRAGSGRRDMRAEWAALAFSEIESGVALDRLLRRGLSHRAKRIRRVAATSLALLKRLEMKRRAAHYRETITALFLDTDPRVVAEAIRAAGNLHLEIMDAFIRVRRHKDSLVRQAAAWALGRLADRPHARDGLTELLIDRHPRVREEAAKSMGIVGDVEVCGDLIPRLRKEGRRNRHAIFEALLNLTKLEIGETIGAWESWWLVAKEKLIQGKKLGLPGEESDVIPGGEGRYGANYYGVQIHSDRILFILDISQSMRFGGIQDDPDRLDMAKTELTRVIDKLKPDMRFNILVFSTGNAVMSTGKLIPATARNRRYAKKWVNRLVAAGGTNTFGALKSAFKKQDEIDTIYLLSDGEPSRGGITEPEALLAWIRQRNIRRGLIINTVALVKWHPLLVSFAPRGQANAAAQFMREVAELTHGKFVRVD